MIRKIESKEELANLLREKNEYYVAAYVGSFARWYSGADGKYIERYPVNEIIADSLAKSYIENDKVFLIDDFIFLLDKNSDEEYWFRIIETELKDGPEAFRKHYDERVECFASAQHCFYLLDKYYE